LLGEEEKAEVIETLDSGWLSTGPRAITFERELAEAIGAARAVAVNSCTAALHLSLVAHGIGHGDEVITSPLTFCATANTIVHTGAVPVLADIDEKTYNIDPEAIDRAVTGKSRAVVPVHYAGHACDMDEIMAIAARSNLTVIEDAAHALGAQYKNRKIGTIGDATCFSFYAIKNITTGEGGAVLTDNEALADRIKSYSLHGIDRDAWKRYSAAGSWYYEVSFPGFKYNMMDLQAALGLHQLTKMTQFHDTRQRYARLYDEAFIDVPFVRTPPSEPYADNARHLYPIWLDERQLTIDRARFIEELRAENIGTTVNFIPLHLHPYYRERFGYKNGDFPVSERVYEGLVSLPIYPKMAETDLQEVATAVIKIGSYFRR
jgi:dTDP-4-amino-4,6-dideoxygalactose transaminase